LPFRPDLGKLGVAKLLQGSAALPDAVAEECQVQVIQGELVVVVAGAAGTIHHVGHVVTALLIAFALG
jgi:hypothetical protein